MTTNLSITKPWPLDTPLPTKTTDCMPAYEEVPIEFKQGNNPWVQWQDEWFFKGITCYPEPLPDIDIRAAMRHLSFIQRSWDTGHEHKSYAVAYLASLWFHLPT